MAELTSLTRADLSLSNKRQFELLLNSGMNRRFRIFWSMVASVVAIGVACWAFNGDIYTGLSAIVFAFLIVGCTPFLNRPFGLIRAQREALEHLAQMLKGTFVARRRLSNYSKKPMYDGLGWFKREENCITAEVHGVKVEMFTYTIRHPFEHRYDRKKLRVARLQFGKEMPHVLIRSKDSGVLGKLDEHVPMTERVRVESEFEKQFTVYTNRRTATDALAIFAPNVLATILDYGKDFDLEILGDAVYVYSDADSLDSNQIVKELAYLQALIVAFQKKLGNYKLVLPNDSYPYMESKTSAGTASIGDSRINGGLVFVAIFDVFSVVRMILSWDSYSDLEKKILPAVVIVSNVVLIYYYFIKRRKRS